MRHGREAVPRLGGTPATPHQAAHTHHTRCGVPSQAQAMLASPLPKPRAAIELAAFLVQRAPSRQMLLVTNQALARMFLAMLPGVKAGAAHIQQPT